MHSDSPAFTEISTVRRAQLVARIETQLRLRDGWLAEIEAVQSNRLLDQVRGEREGESLGRGARGGRGANSVTEKSEKVRAERNGQ